MRIYQSEKTIPEMFSSGRKNMKKKYKSVNSLEQNFIQAKALGGESRKKKSKKQKKQISKKNIKFLEGIGLKVKQNKK